MVGREEVPSLTHAAKEIEQLLVNNKLDTVYISTDAPQHGV